MRESGGPKPPRSPSKIYTTVMGKKPEFTTVILNMSKFQKRCPNNMYRKGLASSSNCHVKHVITVITMMMMPLALKPTAILRGNKLSETAMSSKGYLDVPLTIEVDPNLRGAHQYPDTIQEDIQCPPGISTLRQWGQTKIPSRKHAGKSFEEAHADLGYVHQIWNRRAVSAWL